MGDADRPAAADENAGEPAGKGPDEGGMGASGAGEGFAERPTVRTERAVGARATGVAVTGADAVGAHGRGAMILGALAVGSVAVGALAIGALAIGRLAIRRAVIAELKAGTVEIKHLRIGDFEIGGT